MTEKEIREQLSSCTNYMQLVAEGFKLKSAGEKETTVNRVVASMKNKLLKPIKKVNNISYDDVQEEHYDEPCTFFNNLMPENIYGNKLIITKNNEVILR